VAFKPSLAWNASVSALSVGIIIPAKFIRQSRHETTQAAMNSGIPLVPAFMLTDSGLN
jgi:hypothetical protein